jgi:hypothetical protein
MGRILYWFFAPKTGRLHGWQLQTLRLKRLNACPETPDKESRLATSSV